MNSVAPDPPQAVGGFLDLQNWDFAGENSIPLEGGWAFYWKQLLTPKQLAEDTAVTGYVLVPDNWQDYEVAGEPLPPEGYATFRLRLRLPERNQPYGLYLTGESTAYKLWLDGELLAQDGEVGTSRTDMTPFKDPQVVVFQPEGETADLVMQISNFYHQKAGFRNAILLGRAEPLIQKQIQQLFSETLLFGILVIMGLYHIFLFAFRPQNKAPLYFALLCWLTAVRVGVTNQRIILEFFPNLTWTRMFRLEYLTFFLIIPLFIQFLYTLYPQDVSQRFRRIVWGLGSGFSLLLLWPDLLFLSTLTTPYQAIILLELVYLVYLLGHILLRRREGAWLIAFACLICVFAIIIDILYYQGLLPFGEVSPYGFMAFIFVQAILLSLRFSKAFHKVEDLSVALEDKNVSLARSEKKYRAIFEESKDMIFITEPDGRIINVNPACEALLGYSRQEVLQMNAAEVFVNAEDLLHVRQSIMAQGVIKDVELKLRRKDGREIDTLVSGTLRRDEDGNIVGMQGVARDITDRKRAEQEKLKVLELQKEKEIAEAANEAKNMFLASMSHELRTPLNGIMGYAQILQRDNKLTMKQRDGLNTIYNSGHHLLTLINDILDLARIEARRLEIQPRELLLPEFLADVTDMMKMAARQKQIHLLYEADPNLPTVILADEKRLRQVLLNLLGNAVKFTEKGSVTFIVTGNTMLAKNGDSKRQLGTGRLYFEVQDTGIGIAPDQLEHIFKPFEQTGDARYRAQGTGLGLAISQQLVTMMGGQIQVSSEPGEGSRFWFEATFEVIEETAVPIPKLSKQVTGYEGQRRRLLIVDDRLENLSVLLNLLEPIGFEISLAENGREAVEQISEFRPDLILMDLVMPVMMGFEAATTIRQMPEFATVPIIAISASVLDIYQETSHQVGCDDFLSKPVDATKLLALLQKHLALTWLNDVGRSDSEALNFEGGSGTEEEIAPPPQTGLSSG